MEYGTAVGLGKPVVVLCRDEQEEVSMYFNVKYNVTDFLHELLNLGGEWSY